MGIADLIDCLGYTDDTRDCREALSSLDGALYEMKNLYQERVPYAIEEKVGGLCLTWDETFIALIRYAMSTDCMDQMSEQERELWRYLVEFENSHSTSATTDHCDGRADGATDKRIISVDGVIYPLGSYPLYLATKFNGFMVTFDENSQDFKLTYTPFVLAYPHYCFTEKAEEPLFDVPKAYVYDDLDGQLYKIHECKPYNDCGCDEEIIMENNDCHIPGNPPKDPDAIYDDLYKTGCGEGFCPSSTVNK